MKPLQGKNLIFNNDLVVTGSLAATYKLTSKPKPLNRVNIDTIKVASVPQSNATKRNQSAGMDQQESYLSLMNEDYLVDNMAEVGFKQKDDTDKSNSQIVFSRRRSTRNEDNQFQILNNTESSAHSSIEDTGNKSI